MMTNQPSSLSNHEHQRDASSLRVLGVFFAVLGLTVVFATLWALNQPRAALVNVVSGFVLLSVGAGCWWVARRMERARNMDGAEES